MGLHEVKTPTQPSAPPKAVPHATHETALQKPMVRQCDPSWWRRAGCPVPHPSGRFLKVRGVGPNVVVHGAKLVALRGSYHCPSANPLSLHGSPSTQHTCVPLFRCTSTPTTAIHRIPLWQDKPESTDTVVSKVVLPAKGGQQVVTSLHGAHTAHYSPTSGFAILDTLCSPSTIHCSHP